MYIASMYYMYTYTHTHICMAHKYIACVFAHTYIHTRIYLCVHARGKPIQKCYHYTDHLLYMRELRMYI